VVVFTYVQAIFMVKNGPKQGFKSSFMANFVDIVTFFVEISTKNPFRSPILSIKKA